MQTLKIKDRGGINIEPPPNDHLWKCINGHALALPEGNYSFLVMVFQRPDGVMVNRNIPICPLCYADWLESHVPELKLIGKIDET